MIINTVSEFRDQVFFIHGRQKEFITGGWEAITPPSENGKVSIAEIGETIYLESPSESGYDNRPIATVQTKNAIDVTELEYISVLVSEMYKLSSDATIVFGNTGIEIGLLDEDGNVAKNSYSYRWSQNGWGRTVRSLNVADLTGEYKIYVSVAGGYYKMSNGSANYDSFYARISKIYGSRPNTLT